VRPVLLRRRGSLRRLGGGDVDDVREGRGGSVNVAKIFFFVSGDVYDVEKRPRERRERP